MASNMLIVGVGKGGTVFIEFFHQSKEINIIGVVDINPDALGIRLAKELGIPVASDYREFFNGKIDEIINVTGSEEIQRELIYLAPTGTEIIGGHSAKLIWTLIEEKREDK